MLMMITGVAPAKQGVEKRTVRDTVWVEFLDLAVS